jgi:hypothetical protein
MNSRLSALRSIIPHINLTTVLDVTRTHVQQMIGHDDSDRSELHFAASKTYRTHYLAAVSTLQYCIAPTIHRAVYPRVEIWQCLHLNHSGAA